jgi:serine protease Do
MLRTVAVSLVTAGLCGCVSYVRPLPPVAPASAPAAQAFTLSARARKVALKAIVVDLPVGHVFGEIAWGYSGSCHRNEQLINTQGRFDLELKNYRDVFASVMAKRGYSVDDELEIFRDTKEHAADLLIAAKVVDAGLNECFPNWDGDRLRVKGTAYLKVAWSVYSPIEKKIVFTTTTEGSTYAEIESNVGEPGLLRVALADSTEKLARDPRFKDVVDPPAAPKPAVAASRMKLRRSPPFSGELKANLEAVRKSVATVTSNRGSGSGFVVSGDGKLLTAEHVVSGSRFVKITTSAGRECYGEVVAASKPRDLALISVDCEGLVALPLASQKVLVGGEVFLVGTPLTDKLQFSVTKGVVSGIRKIDELDYIQSDVTTLPGSSGGPLLDGSGNVIGVAVDGVAVGSVPVGVNFFVPIVDLEKYLPIQLE